MRQAILALALLAAGCAGGESEPEVVTVQHHRQQTQVVEAKRVEVTPSLRLVGEGQPVTASAPAPTLPPAQPQAQAPRPTTRLDKLEQKSVPPQIDFLQVGPPVVINTLPTATPIPAVVVTPYPMAPPPAPPPAPPLETPPGFSYQNGGVMGTTAPTVTPTPALPTAEGFQYQP